MSDKLEYSFQIADGDDYKSRYLNYEESGHKLVVYLEMAGKGYDWCAVDIDFNEWTEPKGNPISDEKRKEILSRLREWSKKEKLSIDIGPPIDKEKMFKDYEKKGWNVEHQADGGTRVSPPEKKSFLKRIVNVFKGRK